MLKEAVEDGELECAGVCVAVEEGVEEAEGVGEGPGVEVVDWLGLRDWDGERVVVLDCLPLRVLMDVEEWELEGLQGVKVADTVEELDTPQVCVGTNV